MQRECSRLLTFDQLCDLDEGPFGSLLKTEIRLIPKRAHLTERQSQIWGYVMVTGLSVGQAAELMDVDESTARKHLQAALSRARRVPHVGLLTVLVEVFNWEVVSEALTKC